MEKFYPRKINTFVRSLWSTAAANNANQMSVSRVSKIRMIRPISGSTTGVAKKCWHLNICRWSSTASSDGNKSNEDNDGKRKKKMSLRDKIKSSWDKYGILGLATYMSLNICTFGPIYFALEWDIFNAAAVGLDPVTAITNVINLLLLK